jgi:hypothetical protein
MGFSGFMQTFGWGVGMFLGLWMLDVLPDRSMLWLIFGGIAIVASVVYLWFGRMIGPVKNDPDKHSTQKTGPALVH